MGESIEQTFISKLLSMKKENLKDLFPIATGPIKQKNGKENFYRLRDLGGNFFTATQCVDTGFFKDVTLRCSGFPKAASQNNYPDLLDLAEHIIREMFSPI